MENGALAPKEQIVGSKQHCRISLLFIVLLRQCCVDPTKFSFFLDIFRHMIFPLWSKGLTEPMVVGSQKNCLNETVLLRTQNICLSSRFRI